MRELIYAGVASFLTALLFGPSAIGFLRKLRAGQRVRSAGPASHAVKEGTPTMGGVIIILAAAVGTMLFAEPRSTTAGWLLLAAVGFGLVGLLDDFLKVVMKRSLGLRARAKMAGQMLVAAAVALYAFNNVGTEVYLPFAGSVWDPGPLLFFVLAIGAMVGAANAVNFTDGLDGLAAGATAVAAAVYAVIAARLGLFDAAVFAAALCGACLGFSWYNTHPAQVIMGDTGSLALGGSLGALAVLTRTELVLVIVGGLFVIETLSVVIQVAYFRLTGGKRIFKMSPLHHHFELSGWAEPKVVTRFWLVAVALGVVGILAVS